MHSRAGEVPVLVLIAAYPVTGLVLKDTVIKMRPRRTHSIGSLPQKVDRSAVRTEKEHMTMRMIT